MTPVPAMTADHVALAKRVKQLRREAGFDPDRKPTSTVQRKRRELRRLEAEIAARASLVNETQGGVE